MLSPLTHPTTRPGCGFEDRIHSGEVDVLLVSPERLANEDFLQGTLLPIAERIRLFVVDEAHCISDWGHDFRPDYQRVTRILQALPPNVPVLTTTATANDRVVTDVVAQLGSDLQVLRGPLVRKSLRLQNISLPRASSRMAWLARWLPQLPGSGIIYALTIADAQNIAEWLRSRGIEAYAYWGGLDRRRARGARRGRYSPIRSRPSLRPRPSVWASINQILAS